MKRFIPNADFFVYYVSLPPHVGGFITPNDDHTYSIYIDHTKPKEVQLRAYQHELRHLENDDFSVGTDPIQAEVTISGIGDSVESWE